MEKKICVFFGHRDCPETVKSQIRQAVVDLIENHKVTVGAGRSRPYFVGSI